LAIDGWVRLMVRAKKVEQLAGVLSHNTQSRLSELQNNQGLHLGADAHCLTKPKRVSVSLNLEGDR
jgi:hypothetical protein